MAHSAEDLCEYAMTQEQMLACSHGDIRHGFVLEFNEHQPDIDIPTLEARVNELIRQDLPIDYYDESLPAARSFHLRPLPQDVYAGRLCRRRF